MIIRDNKDYLGRGASPNILPAIILACKHVEVAAESGDRPTEDLRALEACDWITNDWAERAEYIGCVHGQVDGAKDAHTDVRSAATRAAAGTHAHPKTCPGCLVGHANGEAHVYGDPGHRCLAVHEIDESRGHVAYSDSGPKGNVPWNDIFGIAGGDKLEDITDASEKCQHKLSHFDYGLGLGSGIQVAVISNYGLLWV